MEGGYNFNLNDDNNSMSNHNDFSLSVSSSSSSSSAAAAAAAAAAIDSSNIGFKLLKKHGWKEGTGLGASEQGRLEPLEAYVKKNKRGLGADRVKKQKPKAFQHQTETSEGDVNPTNEETKATKREKALSKRIKKMRETEKLMQEKEFERAFFREFWPDNV